MKLYSKLLELKKAVSPILAIILLIVITTTLSAFVYVYVLPWISGVRHTFEEVVSLQYEEIMIDDVYYKNGNLHIYIRNLSPSKVIIDSLYIEYKGAVIFSLTEINKTIESNDVMELIVSVELEYGKSYNVRVITKRGITAERRLVLWE